MVLPLVVRRLKSIVDNFTSSVSCNRMATSISYIRLAQITVVHRLKMFIWKGFLARR